LAVLISNHAQLDVVQITLVKFVGYREWTESLGPDREHLIQSVQGRLHSYVVDIFAEYGAIAHPLRYDIMLAVTNTLDLDTHLQIWRRVQEKAPVPVVMSVAVAATVQEAERKASQMLISPNGGPVLVVDKIPDFDNVCIIHADLRDSTSLMSKLSAYETYVYVENILSTFRKIMQKMCGIALYLGGDNMIGITTPNNLDMELLRKFSQKYNVRIGIGISNVPRLAMMKATWALDKLRVEKVVDVLAFS